MIEKFFTVKRFEKENKIISIIRNEDGKYYLKKQLINKNDVDMMFSLENEILCFEILKEKNIIPNIIEYNLNINKPYLIMEYLNLTRLDYIAFSSLKEKIICMINILTAINIVHNNGIIHCDLKPQNIFADKNFNVKIIDFGISSVNGKNILSNYGSINYCSPEKVNKQKITTYTDIFSLGIIFYKVITSNLPLERNKDNIKEPIVYSKITSIENEELNSIFYKAIDENYSFRYKSVNEFKCDLINFLDKKEG